jgi:hypothetical protein
MYVKNPMWTVFETCNRHSVAVLETGSRSRATRYARNQSRKGIFDYIVKQTQKPKKNDDREEES